MTTKRVIKKITPFEQLKPDAAVLMINSYDPQPNTIKVFLEAINNSNIPYITVANKVDLIDENRINELKKELGIEIFLLSLKNNEGFENIKEKINSFKKNSNIIILGIFNSGKTTLINKLTNLKLKTSDLPGTTLEFSKHKYGDYYLIDTVGQIIDINKPMMVSIDLSGCKTAEDKTHRILQQDADGILATMEIAIPQIKTVAEVLKKQIENGNKIVVTGAGASALVAMEIAGQGLETGLPIMVFTNNMAEAMPISFAKGFGEEEMGLSRYISYALTQGDVLIGISASGGTGFVYDALRRARQKRAITVAITENIDTPLGKAADYVIKSNAKPEGPSSSKIQIAHLAIGHALILTLADERGISADESVSFMLPEHVDTKKMGIK